ncbi:MAG: Crp/Fnr family transcriptional regulator [Terriglobales bacterium]
MAKKNSIPPSLTKAVAANRRVDRDGNAIFNKILLSLSREDFDQVLPKLELVQLALHHVLYEAGETIKFAYFVNTGLISVLAIQPDGKSVEVGLIGNEGFTGLPLLVGFSSSPTRLITQGDGWAYRCAAGALQKFARQLPGFETQLQRFGQRLAMQTTQIAACNRLHEVEERLARWILMSHDRILADTLPLTQEFLGQMLGSRRASVTVAAGILQKAGLISYTRGSVKILNRPKLEEAACECYGIVQRQLKDWEMETN